MSSQRQRTERTVEDIVDTISFIFEKGGSIDSKDGRLIQKDGKFFVEVSQEVFSEISLTSDKKKQLAEYYLKNENVLNKLLIRYVHFAYYASLQQPSCCGYHISPV